MKVMLIDYTVDALNLLLFTKQTRLDPTLEGYEEIAAWTEERKMKELDYMLGTIQSSWEFVVYTFLLQGVSRAFTHQLVRTRAGSYAQESQRTVDKSGFEYVTPDSLSDDDTESGFEWYTIMQDIDRSYRNLIIQGISHGDARGILPTNIATNIICQFSLRTLSDMAKVRLCYRTQGEYQSVFREMRNRVIEVHPWTERFINVHCVAVGTCAFPNFMECPIKLGVFNPETGMAWNDGYSRPNTRKEQYILWQGTSFEADPSRRKI